LRATRWPTPETDASQGVGLGDLQALCAYWANEYDWRAPDAFPLILTHGWPGSVIEFLDALEPLTKACFDYIVPSLPGYGWSDKPAEPAWGVERIAHAWAALMARLGYDRYGAQGTDWGTSVSARGIAWTARGLRSVVDRGEAADDRVAWALQNPVRRIFYNIAVTTP
jgi:pimeloyl-ACP methyl ester carboxylesterase